MMIALCCVHTGTIHVILRDRDNPRPLEGAGLISVALLRGNSYHF